MCWTTKGSKLPYFWFYFSFFPIFPGYTFISTLLLLVFNKPHKNEQKFMDIIEELEKIYVNKPENWGNVKKYSWYFTRFGCSTLNLKLLVAKSWAQDGKNLAIDVQERWTSGYRCPPEGKITTPEAQSLSFQTAKQIWSVFLSFWKQNFVLSNPK